MSMQFVPRFFLKQKIALTINRFEILGPNPDGTPGPSLGVAEQKRMALKERVTFRDLSGRAVFSFGARNIMDLAGTYDVFDENGQMLATFKKDFGASLLRTTFNLEGPGYAGVGQESNMAVAILRRFSDIPFLPVHFVYTDVQGNPLLTISRQPTLRDRYQIDVHDQRIDFRVAASLATAMDVLLQR